MTPREGALEARRKAGVKAIKAAQRTLGLDDGAYRDLLEAQTQTPTATGKRSATKLTLQEQSKVLDYMRQQGAANPKRSGGKKRTAVPAADRAALTARVNTLLAELARVNGGTPYTLAYCDAICKRNGWASRVDFADPHTLHKLVGALSRTVRAKARSNGVQTAV